MKKLITIGILTLAIAVSPMVADNAKAALNEAQITSILNLLDSFGVDTTTRTNVETSLRGGTPATTTSTACTFTRNLYPGVTGTDVQCLQQYLNSAGFTVATTGAGSPGNETTYYGSRTQAAVGAWQDANGVAYGAYKGYFGPVSRTKYSALVAAEPVTPVTPVTPTPGITTPGAEGSLIGTIASTPVNAEVYIGQTGIGAAAIDLKVTGSDILVNRLDVNFNVRPWLYISGLTITDGTTSKSVAVTSANTTEITVGSNYMVRVEGLGINIPKDTTKTLTVKVDGVTALPSGTITDTTITLTFAANAVRGTDGVGMSQYAPTAALTRTFIAKAAVTATLELTANVDNPKDRPAMVSDSAVTSGIVMLKADVKAKNNSAILRTVRVTASTASNTIATLNLYDGDTLLSSTSPITIGTSLLENVNLTIPKDTTKTLTIKADVNKVNDGATYVEGDNDTITLAGTCSPTGGLYAEDATTYATVTADPGDDVVSGAAYYYAVAPSLALNSISINRQTVATGTITYYGKADFNIKLNVTAKGGNIYIPFYSATAASSGMVVATSTTAGDVTTAYTLTSNATESTDSWVIYSGETKWINAYGTLTNNAAALIVHVLTENVKWGTSVENAQQPANTWTWGLTDFKTNPVELEVFQ